jgi:hypothetical protein
MHSKPRRDCPCHNFHNAGLKPRRQEARRIPDIFRKRIAGSVSFPGAALGGTAGPRRGDGGSGFVFASADCTGISQHFFKLARGIRDEPGGKAERRERAERFFFTFQRPNAATELPGGFAS